MVKCVYCGIGFDKWTDYNDHKGVHVTSILPVNTSGRNKTEIVSNAEATWLKNALVGEAHSDTCRCLVCWNKLADKIIGEQEGLI
jgi:hypothetical protein